jgi:hypothetical protein
MSKAASRAGDAFHLYILFRHFRGPTTYRYFQGRRTSQIVGLEIFALRLFSYWRAVNMIGCSLAQFSDPDTIVWTQ